VAFSGLHRGDQWEVAADFATGSDHGKQAQGWSGDLKRKGVVIPVEKIPGVARE